MNPLSILGTGGYMLPIVSNEAILGFLGVDKDAAWLERKTGIKGRSLNFNCLTGKKEVQDADGRDLDVLDYAIVATKQAMRNAGIRAPAVDQVCFATCTPRHLHFMADTIEIHRQLGLRPDAVIDQTDGGCAALAKVFRDVEAHAAGKPNWTALIIAANDVSSFIDRERYLRVKGAFLSPAVFADGAGALVLGPAEGRPHLVRTHSAVDGRYPLVTYRGGGAVRPPNVETLDDHVYLMDGREVAKQFGPAMGRVLSNLLHKAEIPPASVARWYLHQANLRLIERFMVDQKIPWERVPTNVDRIGNTVSASTLLLLNEDIENDQMPSNGPIVFAFVGAGMMEGGAIFMPPT